MVIQIELSPEVEARLSAEAARRGVATEEYAGKLLEDALLPMTLGTGRLTADELRELTEELTRGSEKLPVLPPEATERESFYEDRW